MIPIRVRTYNHHTLEPGHTGNTGGTHPYCELLYITKGQAALEWIGEEYVCHAPGVFLLTPNTPHQLRSDFATIQFWYIELDVEEGDQFVSIEQAVKWNRLQTEADYYSSEMIGVRFALEALVSSLESKYCANGEYDEEIILLDIKKIIRLIHHRLRAVKMKEIRTNYASTKDLIQILMRHMESNYTEALDLTILSNYIHLNPSYLVRVFKQETGVTPMQYLSNLRLSAAKSYLIHTEMGIQQIAEETGFNSIHYFSRQFKRKYGVSPMHWREQARDTIELNE